MNNNIDYIDQLIAKSLAGEASQSELAELEAWKQISKNNENYVLDAEKLISAIDASQETVHVNVEEAWQKLQVKLNEKETKIIPLQRKLFSWQDAAAIALVLLLVVVFKFYNVHSQPKTEVYASMNKPLEKKLPDGSKVFINKNSELSYVVNENNVRQVKLKGEAFFEVVHNQAQPFVVMVDEVMIKDIGTAFNVKANQGSQLIEVLVESGEVHFYSTNNQGLVLVKGEKAVYDRESKLFTKSAINPFENATSYKSKNFEFKGNTLNEVLAKINEVYESNIQLSNQQLGECRLSVVFNNEDLETMVAIIAETMGLEIERKGEVIILKGESCIEAQ